MLPTSAWLRRVISRSTSRVIQPQNKQIRSIFHKKNTDVYRPKVSTSQIAQNSGSDLDLKN